MQIGMAETIRERRQHNEYTRYDFCFRMMRHAACARLWLRPLTTAQNRKGINPLPVFACLCADTRRWFCYRSTASLELSLVFLQAILIVWLR